MSERSIIKPPWGGPPANVVTAAADRDLEAVVAGETHGACDVGAPET